MSYPVTSSRRARSAASTWVKFRTPATATLLKSASSYSSPDYASGPRDSAPGVHGADFSGDVANRTTRRDYRSLDGGRRPQMNYRRHADVRDRDGLLVDLRGTPRELVRSDARDGRHGGASGDRLDDARRPPARSVAKSTVSQV